MDQVGTDTSLVLTIKLIKDFSPAVTLLPVLTPYVGNRNALRIIRLNSILSIGNLPTFLIEKTSTERTRNKLFRPLLVNLAGELSVCQHHAMILARQYTIFVTILYCFFLCFSTHLIFRPS